MLVTTNYAKKIMLAQSIKATQFSRPCRSDSPMGIPIPKNPSDIGIPCNPNHNPNREGNMRRGCPYYSKNTGKTAISVCSVILHCQKYHDLSWDTNSPCKFKRSIRPAR